MSDSKLISIALSVKIKADGQKVSHAGIMGTATDQKALIELLEEIMPDPQAALAKLRASKRMGKSDAEIKADIERLEAQKSRNKLGREALLKAMHEQPSRREEFEAEYAGMKRRYEDYDVRIQALDWVLAGA